MYLFIVNQRSGNGGGRRVWREISQILDDKGVTYEYQFTESAEGAQAYLKEQLASPVEWKAVGVVGGDSYNFV